VTFIADPQADGTPVDDAVEVMNPTMDEIFNGYVKAIDGAGNASAETWTRGMRL
jgi:hypothetical protein